MDLWRDGVRDDADYPDMQTAFENNALGSGDGHGGYHYLGRVSHMLQDMTSSPHIFWQNVWASHWNCEDFWIDKWQHWWTSSGVSATEGPLKPTDDLPSLATLRLDQYTIERINDRCNQVKQDSLDGFMDTLAWLTYFRVSIWGEIKADENNAAPAMTTPTDGVDAQSNSLRTMFGPENIRYILCDLGQGGFNYWTVFDRAGYLHYFEAEAKLDDWWPADGDFPDGHYEYHSWGQSRYTGRFYFSKPAEIIEGRGSGGGTWPRYYPDGTPAPAEKSLADYYGDCLFPLTIRYNAGLLNLAHPSVTIQTQPLYLQQGIYVDGTARTDSNRPFRWPINSTHTIRAPEHQTDSNGIMYIFDRWSDDDPCLSRTINPDSNMTITAFYNTEQ
jgi:hypothetical protein